MDLTAITGFLAILIYTALALIALWGAFCVIMVWRRVEQVRFRSEREQSEFLDRLEEQMHGGDLDAAGQTCDGDLRALPQLVVLAVSNRNLGFAKVRDVLVDRFRRDVLADLEHRLSWVETVIKSAPMVGLFGTVIGMMGAFDKLASQQQDKITPNVLASDISLALVTTACGLAIAIPLVLARASVNVRIRQMEDLAGFGLTRFLEIFKAAVTRAKTAGTAEPRKGTGHGD
ncbi:MAG: MotA/TolQ/ExbB proton channel family protein [Patescibacteria group bacterium]|nr:MotA/TolQ/ExbB proton channel family protein [Patescibacteria group bacterium]